MKSIRALCAVAAALAGCGGGGGDSEQTSPPAPPPTNAAVGGIWEGMSSTGEQLLGLITESGEFQFISDVGFQYVGTLSVSGNAVSDAFVAFGDDGAFAGNASLSGTVQSRVSMSGNSTFTPIGGAIVNSTVTLSYNALYERDSSLALIAGNYRDIETNVILNVNSNGVAFMQDPVSGCVVNGDASIIDAQFNAYRVSYIYSSCTGQFTGLNGRSFQGLATLNNTVTPEELIVGAATGGASASRLGGVFVFERM